MSKRSKTLEFLTVMVMKNIFPSNTVMLALYA